MWKAAEISLPAFVVVVLAEALLIPSLVLSESPSFDCNKAAAGSMEERICNDAELTSLDKQLSEVYKAALIKDREQAKRLLQVEQRGWIKGRNDCWKSDDLRKCVFDSYQRRIVELQARYRLVEIEHTIFYECENSPANEIVVSFFATKPKSIVAERGDRSFLLFRHGEQEIYQGGDEIVKINGNELKASLAFEAPFLNCKARIKE